MRSLLLCALLALPASAKSQTTIAMLQGTSISADWSDVSKCAAKPYPNQDKTNLFGLSQFYFHQINGCRLMLIAHHQGWVDAGREPDADPYQPEPINRNDDFKNDVCNYAGIDKAHTEGCSADK